MRPLSYQERLDIAVSLEDYHKIFYVFWELAGIYYADVKTAAIRFPGKGIKPEMLLDEKFWNDLNHREKLFVVCHECLHVMLDHGIRNGMSVPGATARLVNIAQDITINEMIIDLFNFDRNDLREWKKYCWIDTCFEDPSIISRNETFLYYLNALIKDPSKANGESGDGSGPGDPQVFDDHPDLSDSQGETEESKAAKEAIAKEMAEDLTAEELERILKALPTGSSAGAGTFGGMIEQLLAKKSKKVKINFTHLIRRLKKTAIKEKFKDVETFTHDDRRFGEAFSRKDIAFPGKGEVSYPEKDMLLTAVFMDVSGSCIEYFKTFQEVYGAFDAERRIFKTRLFIFDTAVKEIRPGERARIGGGTRFDIVEQQCLKMEAEEGRYPDCVVVITDGDGNVVKPKAPTKWVWLMTKNPVLKYVHPQSKHFLISNVTFK